jgi:hypothetical protein
VKDSTAAFEATASSTASKTATTAAMTAVASMTPMAAFDFNRRGVGDMFCCRRGAGIEQRKGLGLAWQGQRQYRGGR